MSILKRLSLSLVFAAFATGAAQGQTPLVFTDAELAVPFGAAKGQMAFVATTSCLCLPKVPSRR